MAKITDADIHTARLLLEKFKRRDEVEELEEALREAAQGANKGERAGLLADAYIAVEGMRSDLKKIQDLLE